MTETTVCTLHINIPFDEWLNKYDKDEAPVRTKKNIKVLYRGVSKDNPHKAIMIAQAVEGVIDKHIFSEIFLPLKKWCRYDYCS